MLFSFTELIVSEGSHVRWLKVLGVDFLKPLERQPSLLPAEELRALFPNLPGVRERHARLYAELRSVRSEAANHVVQIRPVADAMLNTVRPADTSDRPAGLFVFAISTILYLRDCELGFGQNISSNWGMSNHLLKQRKQIFVDIHPKFALYYFRLYESYFRND